MLSRRIVLGSLAGAGALVVGWGVLPPRQRLTGSTPLPVAAGQKAFNGWVKIGSDDSVTVMLAKSEMGQGVHTALAMLLADELDADWDRLRTEHPPIDAIYNNIAMMTDGLPFHPDEHGTIKRSAVWLTAKTLREIGLMATGGSSSLKDLWLPMREAGASARAMLVAAAAQGWGVPAAECRVALGVVSHAGSARSARFGELAERAARLPLPGSIRLKTATEFKLIGQPQRRREAASKQDGSARFGIDTVLPGMLYASVLMCPTLGGSVVSFDAKAAEAMPGVRRVLAVPGARGGSGAVAAVADTPWQAMQAAKAVAVTWDHGPAATLSNAGISQQLGQALDGGDGFGYFSTGDTAGAMKQAATTLRAEYSAPLLAHATLEPQNCTVLLRTAMPRCGRLRKCPAWHATLRPRPSAWTASRSSSTSRCWAAASGAGWRWTSSPRPPALPAPCPASRCKPAGAASKT